MSALKPLLTWLRAPLPGNRPVGAPLRFRKQVQMTHLMTRVFEGSVTTADKMFDRDGRQTLPYLAYHDWSLDWRGARYVIYQKDWPKQYAFREGQSFPCWVDPGDLSSVWILGGEHVCHPWQAEEVDGWE